MTETQFFSQMRMVISFSLRKHAICSFSSSFGEMTISNRPSQFPFSRKCQYLETTAILNRTKWIRFIRYHIIESAWLFRTKRKIRARQAHHGRSKSIQKINGESQWCPFEFWVWNWSISGKCTEPDDKASQLLRSVFAIFPEVNGERLMGLGK